MDEMFPKWSAPEPIPEGLQNVQPFDPEFLPSSLRGWITDISERMQCPPDFPAVGAMIAASSVIGRKACIKPKRHDDWAVVPNLWGCIVGRPGAMKSPALSEVLRPLDRLAAEASKSHEEAMRSYRATQKVNELALKHQEKSVMGLIKSGDIAGAEKIFQDIESAGDNPMPPLRRYKVTDATVEALGEILIENPFGTLAYRDELSGLLKSLDKEGQEGARAFYLQAYDGNQGYTFDRIARGRNLHIKSVCLAMLGGIQPGKLQAYINAAVNGGSGDDGLLQRFGFLVWPDTTGKWRNIDRWPDTQAKQKAWDVFTRLDAFSPSVGDDGEEVPKEYRFTSEAQGTFDDWRLEFESEIRKGELHPAMESHLSKYRKLVPAIALVCAIVEGEEQVSNGSLFMALAWSEYLRSHAERAYMAGTRPVTDGAKSLLGKIRGGEVKDGFKPSDIYLKGWQYLSNTEDAHAALGLLSDLGYLRRMSVGPGEKGGRPSFTFQINPSLLRG